MTNEKKTLLIVESPTKARKINQYLGEEYIVRACFGHIADLSNNGAFNLGVDIDNGFKTNYTLMSDKTILLNELMQEAKECKEVLLAPDGDREGGAISMHLYSRLNGCGTPFKRIIIKEITKKGIQRALENKQDILSEANQNIYASQEGRRVLDRIVGFMASPFLMNSYGKGLSAGRVQSIATKLIIDREREIENFIPETYFTIRANLAKNKQSFWAKVEEKVIAEQRAKDIKALLLQTEIFTVVKVEANEEQKKAPPPMITSQLQKVMAKSFGMKPDRTMELAQKLYEAGYITYLRTDSVRSDPDAIAAARARLTEQGYQLPISPNQHKTKDAAQDAHECIRPTDLAFAPDDPELHGEMATLYGLIYRSFLASQMLPAIYSTLKVIVQSDQNVQLKASGRALKSSGFLSMLGITDDSQIDIPSLQEGDRLILKGKAPITVEKKQTQPPPRLTNYSLIEALEKKQIGRPATYAETIAKITSRAYVEMEGNSYRATELGKKITDALSQSFSFLDYGFSAAMERQLDEIEAGKQDYKTMLTNFFQPFKKELRAAYAKQGAEICVSCDSPMLLRNGKSGQFWGCSAYPSCRQTKNCEASSLSISLPPN